MLRTTPIIDQPASREDRPRPVAERRDSDQRSASAPAVDRVDAWGADSFPASDPPSWWAGG